MTNLPDTKKTRLISISEAARYLKVSTKTLHRWEKDGKITSERTSGGHRRYDLYSLKQLKNKRSKPQLTGIPHFSEPPARPTAHKPEQIKLYKSLEKAQKRIIYATSAALGLLLLAAVVPQTKVYQQTKQRLISPLFQNISKYSTQETSSQVLQATAGNIIFNVNVRSIFKQDAEFQGLLNTLSDVNVGANLNVTGDTAVTGDIAANGGTITSTGALTITPGGTTTVSSSLILSDTSTLQVGGLTGTAYNAFANSDEAPEDASIDADNDVYIGGSLEVDGLIIGTLANISLQDADTLDTIDSESFLRSDTTDSFTTGTLSIASGATLDIDGTLSLAATAVTATATEINFLDATTVTAGGILFGDGTNITQDAANLNWDDVNDSLDINGSLVLADASLVDLSAIIHDDAAPQGLKLPQGSLIDITGGGEGYIAYDTVSQRVEFFNGTQWSDISGASTTLQEAYGNDVDGSDAILALNSTDDSVIFRNPATSGTDSGYILSLDQLNVGDVDGLRISNAGTGLPIELTKTSSGQWISFNDGTDAWGLFNYAGSPEGVITADTGTLSMDTGTGTLYVKTDDGDATGWNDLATGGTVEWSLSGTTLHPNLATTDIAVGVASDTLIAPFSVQESTNTVRIGQGSVGAGVDSVLSMYDASDATGSITYTSDTWNFTGGSIDLDGALDVSGTISDGDSDVQITDNLDPSADNQYDLGDTTTSWRSLYLTGSLCFDDTDCASDWSAGGASPWSYDGTFLYPDNGTEFVGVGTATSSEMHGLFTVSGSRAGKALAVLNDTGTDQNILTASASGTTVLNLDRSGNLAIEGAISDLTDGTLTVNDDLAVTGGNVTGANSESIDIGAAEDGSISFLETGGKSITFDIDATHPSITGSTGTLAIGSILDVNGADGSDFAGNVTFNDDVDLSLVATENLNIASDLATTSTLSIVDITGTPSSSAGVKYGLTINQADSANAQGLDASLVIDNTDANLAIADGLLFAASGAGGFTDFIDTASGTFKVDGSGNITGVDIAATGGDINGGSGENIDLGEDTADTIEFFIATTGELRLNASALAPTTDSGLDLGSSSSQFADLFLDGGNINLDNATDIDLDDDLVSALTISEGANEYLNITTDDTDTSLTLDLPIAGGTSTTANLFTSTVGHTINFGTGATNANTINIGTGAIANTITIGTTTASSALALNDDNWNITGAGLANFVSIGAATPGTGAFTTLSAVPTGTDDITLTTDSDSTLIIGGLSAGSGSSICIDATDNIVTCASGGGSSPWTLSNGYLYPDLGTEFVAVGTTTEAEMHGLFTVSGTRTGKALAIFNDTGTDQNILTASASGTTVMTLDRNGALSLNSTTANADVIAIAPNAAGADTYTGTVNTTDLTADRTYTLPNETGSFCLSSGNCAGGAGGSKWTDDTGITYFTAYDATDDVAIGDVDSTSEFYFDIVGEAGRLIMNPGTAGTKFDVNLETEWTGGTLFLADFASSTTQASDIVGTLLDFNTNLTAAANLDVTGYEVRLPALTQSTTDTTTYTGFNLPTAGALVQDTLAGTLNWLGVNIQMPDITQTTGTVTSTGISIAGGSVTSGEQIGIDFGGTKLDLDADNDTSITADGDDQIDIEVGGNDELVVTATALYPASAEGLSLGGASNEWEQLYLGDDAGINFGLGDDFTLLYDQAGDSRLEMTATNQEYAISLGNQDVNILGSADGVDALTVTAGDILVTDGDVDLSSGDFNVTLDSADTVNITGTQPSSVGTTPGTAASDIIGLTAATGGDTTIADTGVGGIGQGLTWTLGTGGVAGSASTSSTGGAGGAFGITGGTGGAASVGSSANTGGAGGTISLVGGTGGAASGGASNDGGVGGDITITGGAAGSSGDVNGGTININSGAISGSGTSTINIGTSDTTAVNFGDSTVTKTIDIGGVTSSAADTISIATNGTAADTLAIGNSNASSTLALIGGDAWSLDANGVLTLSADSSQTTAIVATDTDYTNALSVGDNNIIGTTANIDLTYFDVAGATGAVTIDPQTTGTYLDFTLETTWTTGTLINADFGGVTTLSGAATGLAFDLSANVTDGNNATTGISLTLPDSGSATATALDINGTPDLGIDLSGATIGTNDIVLSNSETISNTSDGTVDIGTTTLQLTGGTTLVSDQTTFNLVNTASTTVNLAGAATTLNIAPTGASGSIVLSGGSGDTGCTLDGTTGDYTCSGSITGGATGTAGYWTRTSGGVVHPATGTDDLAIGGTDSTADFFVSDSGVATFNASTTGTLLDFVLETEWTTGTLIDADFGGATTLSGAVVGLDFDLSSNVTDGDNATTGISLTLPDSGASGTAIALEIKGTPDFGIDLSGATIGTNDIRLSNSETITNTTASEIILSDGTNTLTFDLNEDTNTAVELITSSGDDIILNPTSANVGVGDTTPASLFTVGNTDLFQIDSNGEIVAIGGAAHTIVDTVGTLDIDSATTGTINIGTDANAETVNLGTGGAAKTLVLGSTNTTSTSTLQSGTGGVGITTTSTTADAIDINAQGVVGGTAINLETTDGGIEIDANGADNGDIIINAADVLDIDSADALSINSSAGVINIGDDAVAQNINIGTGAAARTITMGNATDATALALNSGTGSQTFTSQVVSGTTTTSAFVFDATAITTGTAGYITSDSITDGKLLDLNTSTGNTLAAGTLLNVQTTSTGVTGSSTGLLGYFDWSPGSTTTATGDLLRINIGANGNVDNVFNVTDAGSTLFSVSESSITSALPHEFTSPGDVIVAYDIEFTNQTSSFIKTNAPFTIQVGESPESNNLTLETYNAGDIVFNNVDNGQIAVFEGDTGNVGVGTATPDALLHLADDRTSGELLEIDWTGATTQSGGALTGALIDFTNLTADGSNALYGLHINDHVGATASTEYALYQQGTNWDYGAYFEDDVYFAGAQTAAGAFGFDDDISLQFGTGNDVSFLWDTADADAHFMSTVLLDTSSMNWIVNADDNTDWTHADSSNPTLFIQSADATSVADYLSLSHDQTDAQITSGAGDIVLNPADKVRLDDNKILAIGSSEDLQISHNTTDSIIDNNTGSLQIISASNIRLSADNDTDDYLYLSTESDVPILRTAGTANLGIIPDGGTVDLDGALDLDSAAATAVTFGDTTNVYFTYDGTTDASDTLFTYTSASSGITSGSLAAFTADTITDGTAIDVSLDGLTTGTGLHLENAANTLTTGTLLQADSTSTAVTGSSTGLLGYFNWAPGSSTTATGDLFRINIGPNGNVGNLLNITDDGSSLFSVSETTITSALPHEFTSAGDVIVAYDIEFTNQTSSNIITKAPFTLEVGQSFESNNLTLKTYNSGDVVFDIDDGSLIVEPTGTGTKLDFALETEWTAGDLVNADWGSATTQTAALTGIDLDFTNLTSLASSTTYGLHLNDLAAQTSSTEYAIYQEGTNWDYGGYFEDDVYIGGTLTISASTDITTPNTEALTLDSGTTGAIDIGTDASAETISIGTGGAAKTLVLGSTNTSSTSTLQSGTGGLTLTTTSTTADAIDINAQGVVGGTAINLETTDGGIEIDANGADNGDIIINAADVLDIDSADALSINSSAGVINIGDDAVAQNINIGTGAAARTITMGNATSTSALALNSGTGAQTFTSQVVTGTTTTSAFVFDATAITSGTAGYITSDSITGGKLLDLNTASGNTLTTGTLLNIQTTSTGVTGSSTGLLGYFDWSPGSTTTATGDLMRINIGASGNVDNIFNVTDAGTSLFSVGETTITSALPHSFTAAGDVSVAYDLNFTNQTSSLIESNASLTIRAGESFESNDLTLETYNSGNVYLSGAHANIATTPFAYDAQETLAVNDTTPDVSGGSNFITANTSSTTISDFDAGSGSLEAGHIIFIEINDANTIFDCTASGLSCGSGDMDILASGDETFFIYDGADWKLLGWVDASGDYGTTTGGGADIAEYFVSNQSLEAGDVVSTDTTDPIKVLASTSEYENETLGVISTDPGIILGEAEPNVVPVALAGRVPVKITSTSDAITAGDYITASSEPGKAMKATRAGRVIGQALEPWTPGTNDVITVFVNPTWHDPQPLIALDASGSVVISDGSGTVLASFSQEASTIESDTVTVEGQVEASEVSATNIEDLTNNYNLLDVSVTDLFANDDIISADMTNLESRLTLLEAAVINNSIATESATLTDLTVLNEAVLGDTVVNGDLTVGTLFIDGVTNTIDSLDTLKIQSLGLADIEIMGGLVTIDTQGNVTAQKFTVEGETAGSSTLPAGGSSVFVVSNQVTADSLILVTPKTKLISPLSVTSKDVGLGFTVELPTTTTLDVEFDWFIVDKK